MKVKLSIQILYLIFLFRILVDQRFFEFPSIINTLLSGLTLFVCFAVVLHNKKFNLGLFDKYFLFWIFLVLVISFINRSAFAYSGSVLKEVLRLVQFLSISLFVGKNIKLSDLHKFFQITFGIVAIVGLLQLLHIIPILHVVDGNRIESLTGHPNALANFFVVQNSYWLYNALYKKGSKSWGYFILGLLLLVLTYSRAAILFSSFVSGLLVLNYVRKVQSNSLLKIATYFGFLLFSFIMVILLKDRFINELNIVSGNQGGVLSAIENRELSGSMTWRLFNWYSLLRYVYDYNFFFGCGINITDIFNENITGAKLEAHNDYVKYIFEMGIIGFLVFVAYLISWIKKCFKNVENQDHLMFLYLFIGFSIFKLIDGIEQSNLFMIMFVITGAAIINKKDEKNTTGCCI